MIELDNVSKRIKEKRLFIRMCGIENRLRAT